jgi:TonB family protein
MGYHALLFCPDEKTARTVTQVLSELDFTVVPCTEPFAAVKKLMSEHFDAVVVDCDNEQNATLLFKSARNTTQNQSSLAVAVVEGQAGVAKAFRIGANLVLTKPINVEQAKGTLRVARGLLRKNEGAKPATGAASPAPKLAASSSVSMPVKPVSQHPIPSASSAAPVAPLAVAASASSPTQKPAAQPRIAASIPVQSAETDDDLLEVSEEVPSPAIAKTAAQTSTPKISAASLPATGELKIDAASGHSASSGFAGSAPAPAREPKPGVSAEKKLSSVVAEPHSPTDQIAAGDSSPSAEENAASAAFTFGGNVADGAKSGGTKKALLAVAAVVLIAAVGYAVWMQWVRSGGGAVGPTQVVPQPVTTPSTVPQMTPNVPPPAASSTPSSAASPSSSVPSPTPDSASAPQGTGTATTSSDTHSDTQTKASAENAPAHSNKIRSEPDSSKSSASAAAKSDVSTTKVAAAPIVIKSGAVKPAKSPVNADAPAPSLTGFAPADSGELPSLAGSESKAAIPVLQTMSVSQGVSQGLLLKKVQPRYPANALRLRLEGAVDLMATISTHGDISAVKVLTGDQQLARAAVDAVKQWKYKPYLLNGTPVEIQTQITVKFKLPE